MNDSFCRRCNMDLIGEDNMKVGEYSFCMSCMILNEKDKLKKAIQALESIIIRCTEGDPRSDWIPVIRRIAQGTLDEIRKRSTDLRGEEAKESQDKQVEKME